MFTSIILTGLILFSAVNIDATSLVDLQAVSASGSLELRSFASNLSSVPVEKLEEDERAKKIDAYFEKRDMPLAGYGDQFVKVADKYDIDWRLLPAISVRESSGGKRLLNNNPFGWGSCKIAFKDFNESIEVLGKNLSGNNPNTARYYKDNTSYEKLYWYNGTVMPTYPDEVVAIMDAFERTEA